jgi:hypothetical protein
MAIVTEEEKKQRYERCLKATEAAKKILKKGDRIRVRYCPGTRRTITFECWDGMWIVSKSGGNDYSALTIDLLNKKPINFCD